MARKPNYAFEKNAKAKAKAAKREAKRLSKLASKTGDGSDSIDAGADNHNPTGEAVVERDDSARTDGA